MNYVCVCVFNRCFGVWAPKPILHAHGGLFDYEATLD
jgi:hypothetical protein